MASWRKRKRLQPDFHKSDIELCPATKFFDQLSFIGDEIVGCFVLETSKGYVMFDCMNPDQRCIDIIEKGFVELGFDLTKLYAIVITHGHGDHYGMAGYFKEKYHSKIYMSEIDYLFAKNMPDGLPWKAITFTVDEYLTDNSVLQFGTTEVHAVLTPGHTKGCFSFIIPVTDEGRKHRVALWGGTGIMPDTDKEVYYQSLLKFSEKCRELHVDGEIATHPCVDLGLMRLELVRNITDGIPNPFVLGEDGYAYYEQQFYDLVGQQRKN